MTGCSASASSTRDSDATRCLHALWLWRCWPWGCPHAGDRWPWHWLEAKRRSQGRSARVHRTAPSARAALQIAASRSRVLPRNAVPTHLHQRQRRALAAIVGVPVNVQHLRARTRTHGEVQTCVHLGAPPPAVRRLPGSSSLQQQLLQQQLLLKAPQGPRVLLLTLRPATDSRPEMQHSFKPVPSTMASYSSFISRADASAACARPCVCRAWPGTRALGQREGLRLPTSVVAEECAGSQARRRCQKNCGAPHQRAPEDEARAAAPEFVTHDTRTHTRAR